MDLRTELTYVQEGMAALEDYLNADPIYWPLRHFSATLPAFSIGGLLESLRRLEALADRLSPEGREILRRAREGLEQARQRYAGRYAHKVERELHSRLDAWAWFLEDYERGPEEGAASFPAQVHIRLKIALLLEEAEGLGLAVAPLRRRLQELDQTLRRHWIPGPFLWEEALQAAFPQDRFWWLYGRPRGQREEAEGR